MVLCCRCFGSGHTMLGTRADWRGHMERAAAEIGVQGLRMHGAHAPRPASCASASPKTPAMGVMARTCVGRLGRQFLARSWTVRVRVCRGPCCVGSRTLTQTRLQEGAQA